MKKLLKTDSRQMLQVHYQEFKTIFEQELGKVIMDNELGSDTAKITNLINMLRELPLDVSERIQKRMLSEVTIFISGSTPSSS